MWDRYSSLEKRPYSPLGGQPTSTRNGAALGTSLHVCRPHHSVGPGRPGQESSKLPWQEVNQQEDEGTVIVLLYGIFLYYQSDFVGTNLKMFPEQKTPSSDKVKLWVLCNESHCIFLHQTPRRELHSDPLTASKGPQTEPHKAQP